MRTVIRHLVPLGTGLDEVTINDLEIDPADPAVLYLGTAGGGVMRLRQE